MLLRMFVSLLWPVDYLQIPLVLKYTTDLDFENLDSNTRGLLLLMSLSRSASTIPTWCDPELPFKLEALPSLTVLMPFLVVGTSK